MTFEQYVKEELAYYDEHPEEDDQDYTFLVTVTANDLEEAERQVPFDSILYAVNGDTRF